MLAGIGLIDGNDTKSCPNSGDDVTDETKSEEDSSCSEPGLDNRDWIESEEHSDCAISVIQSRLYKSSCAALWSSVDVADEPSILDILKVAIAEILFHDIYFWKQRLADIMNRNV